MMKLKKLALIGAMAGMMTSGAFAATADGDLEVGATAATPGSIGTMDLLLNVPDRVQISGLAGNTALNATAQLELVPELGDASVDDYVGTAGGICIFRNLATAAGTNNFEITAGSQAGTALALKDGGGNEVSYGVTLDGTALGATATAMRTIKTTGTANNCVLAEQMTLEVRATQAAVAAEPAGAYTDTLVLTVTAL